MKKIIWIPLVALLVLVVGYFSFGGGTGEEDLDQLVEVKRGTFHNDITTTGELEAKNSVYIMGPSALRNANIYQVKIEQMINEGKMVKKGDFIASLDRSELTTRIRDVQLNLDTRQSQYTQTSLDTTLTLRQARDELVNLRFGTTEKRIVLEQSKYEPPATIKQAQIEVEKSERALNQAQENYKIKRRQAIAKMQEVATALHKAERQLQDLNDLLQEFTIRAPEDGMLIYEREYNGSRRKAGSFINAWELTVATLPDLTTMLSRTYVNEVDIRKVKPGQLVRVGLDAFPEKQLTGKVVKVANVGEQKPNSDAKVFEVSVQIMGTDTTLRPAMTTSNAIIAEELRQVLTVPLESLHNQGDSLVFVYKKTGLQVVRQEVEIGKTNSNEAIVLRGLAEGDRVYTVQPKAKGADSQLVLLEWKNGRKNKTETAAPTASSDRVVQPSAT